MSSKKIILSAQDATAASTKNYIKMILRYLASEGMSSVLHYISNVDVNKYCRERVETIEEVSNTFVDNS